MPIVELKAENVKRLKAVRIRPDGSLIQITGKNGAGKSSVLDSIAMALGGRSQIPDRPVREGQRQAEIVIELPDMTVTRRWTRSGQTTLQVEAKNGCPVKSPQAVLDKLVGDLTFDPCAFERMKAAEQIVILKRIAGVDTAEIDANRAKVYAERTDVNRAVTHLEALLAARPTIDKSLPESEMSPDTLKAKLSEAESQRAENNKIRVTYESAKMNLQIAEEKLARKRAEVEELERTLCCASEAIHATKAAVDELVDPDVDAIMKMFLDMEATNAKIRAQAQTMDLARQLAATRAKSESLTETIKEIDENKAAMLADAKLPIEGLAWDECGVTFEGIPFEQCSASQRLRVSVAMAVAMQPALKIMLVREGSLLDSEGLALLAKLAEDAGAQVWLERVTDGQPIGIVIEDGEVANQE